ncbi:hypothetical protein, partial [Burkholderia cenocepacia]|uniref:hypothetical protein n=1 Tax=Burkholderia cenocepacia TaxID=95486 RepID=UPI001F2F2D68
GPRTIAPYSNRRPFSGQEGENHRLHEELVNAKAINYNPHRHYTSIALLTTVNYLTCLIAARVTVREIKAGARTKLY